MCALSLSFLFSDSKSLLAEALKDVKSFLESSQIMEMKTYELHGITLRAFYSKSLEFGKTFIRGIGNSRFNLILGFKGDLRLTKETISYSEAVAILSHEYGHFVFNLFANTEKIEKLPENEQIFEKELRAWAIGIEYLKELRIKVNLNEFSRILIFALLTHALEENIDKNVAESRIKEILESLKEIGE